MEELKIKYLGNYFQTNWSSQCVDRTFSLISNVLEGVGGWLLVDENMLVNLVTETDIIIIIITF